MTRPYWLLFLLFGAGACGTRGGSTFDGLEIELVQHEATPGDADARVEPGPADVPAEESVAEPTTDARTDPDAVESLGEPSEATDGTAPDEDADAGDVDASDLPTDLAPTDTSIDLDADVSAPDADLIGPDADQIVPDAVDAVELDLAPADPAPDTTADVEPPPDCGGPCVPLITEFMAENDQTLKDEDGDASDWIELYNPTPVPLDLEGFHLTDDPAKPGRWTLPAVTLAPGAYLVVFASNKDRANPDAELHTNFKLAREGEYLGLTSPDYQVVQAFVDTPPQVADVAYGVSVTVARTTLIAEGASARYRVPDGPLPSEWQLPAFADDDWLDGLTGLGFDGSAGPEVPPSVEELGAPLADSLADWSTDGLQGANGWTYGYFDRTAAPEGIYSADAFVPFPRDGSGWGASDFWDGSSYEWFAGDPPWTALGAEYMHPSSPDNGVEHWPVRRYQAPLGGPCYVQWRVAKAGAGGNGVTARVFLQGAEVDAVSIAGDDTIGVTRTLVLPTVAEGDRLDVALDPTGPDGACEDWSDGSLVGMALWRLPTLADAIATDVALELAGLTGSMAVRLPFEAADLSPPNRLRLRMKYDDGFAAWLNGTPLAAANVPDPPGWDALAPADRSVAAAVTFANFDVGDGLAALVPGPNVLTLLVLNSSVNDPTLLALPVLEGRRVAYDPGVTRYYDVPTPGADNDDVSPTLGPIVEHRTPNGSVAPGQGLVVSARVVAAGAPLAAVELVTRVMFGPETSTPMLDGGDGLFSVAIPADTAAPGQMIRWYVVATDGAGHATRSPAFRDPLDSEEYFGTVVDDPTVITNLPVFQWFVEDPEAAKTWAGTRSSLFYAGELYDNVRFDLHGQSTSGFPKKSYNVDFTADHRFQLMPGLRRMKDLNLLTNWADKTKVRNTLAYEIYRDAGAGYHLAFPVRVQQNGAFFEVADFVEDGDDRWLERLGLDPDAGLYKMYDGLWDPAYGEKKTRKDEDNSDLAAFITDLDRTGDELRLYVYDHVNLAAMANFYAALTVTATTDCCHKNYYVYHDQNGTGEWWYLPWDVDLTFGHNWTPQKYYFEDALYPENPLYVGWSKLTMALFPLPELQAMYLRRLRTLMDRLVQPPDTPQEQLHFEARMDQLAARIGADAALDHDAWPTWGLDETMEQAIARVKADFLAPRRVFLYETMTGEAGPPIPPAQEHPVVLIYDGDPSPEAPAEAWVLLLNPNYFAVDLSGWRLVGDLDLLFQPGTVLPALGQLYVSPDVVAFRARPSPPTGGQGLFVQGGATGTLLQLESLMLLDEDGVPVPQSW